MKIRLSLAECTQAGGGAIQERFLESGDFANLKQIRGFLGEQAVRAGYHFLAPWAPSNKSNGGVTLSTQAQSIGNSNKWLEVRLSWEEGFVIDEVVAILTA